MATTQRRSDRLFVYMAPEEILALPVRRAPEIPGVNTTLIEAAWEMIKLYKADKLNGLAADKATVQFIDGRYEVCFYAEGAA